MGDPREVCILAAVRTPLGSFRGSLSSLSATELGAIAIKAAIERAKVPVEYVDEVFMGNVCSSNLGQAPATQCIIKAGLPSRIPCTGINKVCASGMKAVMLAEQSIRNGDNNIVLAGGMESMSNVPHYLPRMREGCRMGHAEVVDGLIKDGLWDPYNQIHMGTCAEMCAKRYGFIRSEQDAHALSSHKRARLASTEGWTSSEVVPVTLPNGQVIREDDGIKRMDPDKLTHLKPAFAKEGEGTVTPGNASPMSDGAAVLVLASRAMAEQLGRPILAVLRGHADANQAPEWFTTTPSLAIPKALTKTGIKLEDVDYIEVNEAFSVVDLANRKILGLPDNKVNVHGGAVALGHPLGASGARILVTLLNVLTVKGGRFGVAAICNGGGGASAMVIERCPLSSSASSDGHSQGARL
ncbi:hypothetical protein CEUSTIGMA_g5502.t1 [Chlamydomonas eustigma]|uniref:acetyl-CoA C-acetyltransferase n=1 Tax=Chlamydomonas eustigma TaxID=1157962 RepID=A0A250X5M5_9CHLO|nr:hypothetical protein CEUSTIGMA_g5502.t1 [Chlamydomonas eustigma]|eukprot:GAX78060.1 hypothetical protein CEUSTIGMA_g5502.t1 [Chlamydomonas eustigma]